MDLLVASPSRSALRQNPEEIANASRDKTLVMQVDGPFLDSIADLAEDQVHRGCGGGGKQDAFSDLPHPQAARELPPFSRT